MRSGMKIDDNTKRRIVHQHLYQKPKVSVSILAERYAVSPKSIHRWVKEAQFMAKVEELVKLNRDQLNQLANEKGVDKPEGYETKKDLAAVLVDRVTPEDVERVAKDQPADATANTDPADDEKRTDRDDEVSASQGILDAEAQARKQTEEDVAAAKEADTKQELKDCPNPSCKNKKFDGGVCDSCGYDASAVVDPYGIAQRIAA